MIDYDWLIDYVQNWYCGVLCYKCSNTDSENFERNSCRYLLRCRRCSSKGMEELYGWELRGEATHLSCLNSHVLSSVSCRCIFVACSVTYSTYTQISLLLAPAVTVLNFQNPFEAKPILLHRFKDVWLLYLRALNVWSILNWKKITYACNTTCCAQVEVMKSKNVCYFSFFSRSLSRDLSSQLWLYRTVLLY